MEVIYKFTPKEKKLIEILKSMNYTYNYSMEHDAFRKNYKKELQQLIQEGLLYHSNKGNDGQYIRFSATEKGLAVLV